MHVALQAEEAEFVRAGVHVVLRRKEVDMDEPGVADEAKLEVVLKVKGVRREGLLRDSLRHNCLALNRE